MLVTCYWVGLGYMIKMYHHGKENTYDIQHGGKLHILKPFKEEGYVGLSVNVTLWDL